MDSSKISHFRRRVNNGLLALAFVLILATSAVSVTSTNELGASIGMVSRTQKTLELVTRMKVAIGDAQANGLQYLIAGDSDNQLAQRQALAEIYALKVQLNDIIKDNALQRSYMVDFSQQYDAFLARSMESMAYKQRALKTGREIAPIKRIREGVGFGIIKDLRRILDKMAVEENRLMILRVAERDTLVKQTNATVLIANALALAAGVIGFVAIRRSQEESKKMLMVELRAEQARQASEEKSRFLANMSHEIRTPMNAIFGFTQLLSESVVAPIEREWVSSIRKSGQMLLALINDVLDLSKIEAGKLQLQVQPTDINELVDEIVEMFLPDAYEKDIFLKYEKPNALNQPLMLDAQRIRQILMNLLSNAIKYTEHGGIVLRLEVTLQKEAGLCDLQLSVTDSGAGIASEQLEKIFEPFHQADSPDGKFRQGTGLGLSICRRLVNAMRGKIQVVSVLGKGSTFTVEIPNVGISEIEPGNPREISAKVDFNLLPALKVLVVDDVAWNTDIVRGYLLNSHHDVQVASNGLDALAIAKTLKPDVVLMDLRMPGMNGFETSDAIQSDPELQEVPTKIIAVTASSLVSEEKVLRQSFDAYVRKPFTPQDLFNALDSLFGMNRTETSRPRKTPGQWSEQHQKQWQQLRSVDLRALQQSMRMREIGDYAKKLRQFSADSKFDLLGLRASALSEAVQAFDVVGVNNALAMIAAMPENFDGN